MSQKDQVEGHQIPNQLIKDRLATYMQRLSKQQKTKQKKQQKTKHQKKQKTKQNNKKQQKKKTQGRPSNTKARPRH